MGMARSASQPLPPWAHRLRRRGALEGFSTVFVAVDGVPAGALALRDPVRPDAARTLRDLRRAGLLAPVAGAVLQEAIDVAVIANALRALGAGHHHRPPRWVTSGPYGRPVSPTR